jgi:hypothetical protein
MMKASTQGPAARRLNALNLVCLALAASVFLNGHLEKQFFSFDPQPEGALSASRIADCATQYQASDCAPARDADHLANGEKDHSADQGADYRHHRDHALGFVPQRFGVLLQNFSGVFSHAQISADSAEIESGPDTVVVVGSPSLVDRIKHRFGAKPGDPPAAHVDTAPPHKPEPPQQTEEQPRGRAR